MGLVPEQVEFYATCHPPLRLKGVKEVTDSAVRHLGERLQEILYEPELPAFKLVSALDDRDVVLQEVQQILADVLHKDFDAFKGSSSSSMNEEDLLEFDSDLSGRVTPWSDYDNTDEAALARFDDYRFPRAIHDKCDRLVWRGLEKHTGWTYLKLVDEVKRFWKGRNVPVNIRGLKSHLGCQIDWNRAETLLYIGTDLQCSSVCLQEAANALQNLIEFFAIEHIKSKHIVLSDCQKNAQFIFRTFSHLGTDKTTYLTPDSTESYPLIMKAATVRSMFSDGEPPRSSQIPDQTNCSTPDATVLFEAFDGYLPRSGTARGVAMMKDTGCEVMDDPFQLEGVPDPQTTWYWPTANPKSCSKRANNQADINQGPLSETPLTESMHLLDSDLPDTISTEEFVPLQHPMQTSSMFDGTSTMSTRSPTEPDSGDSDQSHDDSDLIEFEDSTGELSVCSNLAPGVHKMPSDIQELGIAFGKLDLKDYLGIGDGEQDFGIQDEQGLGNPDDHLGVPGARSSYPRDRKKSANMPISKFWSAAKPELQYLFDALRLSPGRVGLELRLGRIYLCKFDNTEICNGPAQRGPSRTAERTSQYLQSSYPDGGQGLGFSTILSTCAADATFISKIKPHGKGEWQTSVQGRRLLYDLHCRPKDTDTPAFTITIDADTFAYEINAGSNELASTFVHCPQSAWDMKIVALHHSSPQEVEKWMDFSKHTVESLNVSYTTANDIVLTLIEEANSVARVEEIKLRQVADYGNTSFPGSIMTISLTRLMSLRRKSNDERGPKMRNHIQGRTRKPIKKPGNPNQWVEVTMQSRQGRRLFAQNDETLLDFGKRAAWTDTETVDAPGGVLDELCWPALGMIREMDGCGLSNDNDQATQPAREEPKPSKQTLPPAQPKARVEFW